MRHAAVYPEARRKDWPVYARLFGFMAFLSGTLAIIIGGVAREDWRLYSTGTATPVDVSLIDLTTDGSGGGDLRASSCAVTAEGSGIALTKNATVVSYGAEADAIDRKSVV